MKINTSHFSPSYANVISAKMLAYCALPFANLALSMGLSPMALTTISNIFAIFAVASLWSDFSGVLFASFWFLSVILDFADGILARAKKSSSALGSFYDKFSDSIKMLSLPLFCIFRHNHNVLTIIALSCILLIALASLAELQYRNRKQLYDLQINSQPQFLAETAINSQAELPQKSDNLLKKILKSLHLFEKSKLLFINATAACGNIFLYYLPLGFGVKAACGGMLCLILVYCYKIYHNIRKNIIICRKLDAASFKWKY